MQRRWSVAVLVFLCFIILLLIMKQPTLTTRSGAVDQTSKTMLLLERITEERDMLSVQHNLLQV